MAVERTGAAVPPRQFSSGAEESARLSALRSYCVLETGREARFDDLTCLASTICETPVSLISLVDTNRLFFKSAHGMDAREVPYPDFFCGHAIRQRDIFVVPDANEDLRFANHPLGHEVGDFALRGIADELSSCVREEDIACRAGGEEFVIILPGAGKTALRVRAEAVRRTIERAQIPAGDGILKLTVSIGLATFPSYGDTGQAVLRAADVALYKAKAAGRNRVTLCTPNVVRSSSAQVA